MARDSDLDIRFKVQRVTLYPDRVQAKLNEPGTPVAVKVATIAEALVETASTLIGIRRYSGQSPYFRSDGHLKDSGRVEAGEGSGSRVIFDHPAARVHHDGASGHPIGAQGKVLWNPVDPARTAGGTFYANRQVNHRGAVANPYITNAASQLGLRLSGSLLQGSAGPFPIVRVRDV